MQLQLQIKLEGNAEVMYLHYCDSLATDIQCVVSQFGNMPDDVTTCIIHTKTPVINKRFAHRLSI